MILALVERKGQKLSEKVNRRCHDTHHNDTQVNDIQHNDTQHKGLIRDSDTQPNNFGIMLSAAFYLLLC
jgi:hypothetical protein